jgi:hypothetical protein
MYKNIMILSMMLSPKKAEYQCNLFTISKQPHTAKV